MNSNIEKGSEIIQVPIEDIIPNRFQPRLNFDDKSLEELANSIKQHGIIQPLILRKLGEKYEIVAGERRYKAAIMAGLVSVPAVITELDDNASAEVAIVENVQRKDLTAIEEAKSYKALLDKGYMTQEDLAKKMGLSQSNISNKLRLLTLDESVQEAVIQEKISERHARSLLKLKTHEEQRQMLDRVINERLTVRQLEEELKKIVGTENEVENIIEKEEDNMNDNTSNSEKSSNIEDIFSVPNKMPNKFFNFLEDEAVNMNVEEKPLVVESPSTENESVIDDGIEMLDGLDIPPVKPVEVDNSNDNINKIIDAIRKMQEENDNMTIEEISLPDEYHIKIIIKKD